MESPAVGGAILSHLSGSTRKGDVHLAFHWVVPSSSTSDEDTYFDPTYDEFVYERDEPASTADSVETMNADNDQTAEYINPDYL